VVLSPIIRSAYNCIYSIWYLSHRYCYLPLSWKSWQVAVTVWQIPDAVDTVVCASDDGWKYHPKHVQQFPDIINCVTLHLVGYILEYNWNKTWQYKVKELKPFSLLTRFWYTSICNMHTSFTENFTCNCLRRILLFGFFSVLYTFKFTFEAFYFFTLYVYFTL
jgi:hypothetical protein